MAIQRHGYCTLCRSRCGALYSIEGDRLLSVAPDPEHPTGAALCPKGRAAPEIVHSPRRLTRPLRRTNPKTAEDPGWVEIGWDEALDEIAARFDMIRRESGPEAVAFSVTSPSGTPISDGIDWVERFIRLFGSPNIAYATEICNWHKDHAHAFTFGRGIPTADYANTDLALLWGHNPARVWLAQSTAIAKARARGAKVAVVDPRSAGSGAQADLWVRVRPGSDAALALGVANRLIETGRYDQQFVRRWTNGPLLVREDTGRLLRGDDLADGGPPDSFVGFDGTDVVPYDTRLPAPDGLVLDTDVVVSTRTGNVRCTTAFQRYRRRCAEWPLERAAAVTWAPEADIAALADAIADARRVAYHSWSGVGQHTNATQTERAIACLYALTGSFDAPGGNVIHPAPPVNAVTSFDQLDSAQRAKALGIDERPLGPPSQGWVTARDLYTAILDEKPYPVRAMMGFGSNLLVSQADPLRGREALQHLEFHVHANLFMNPTAGLADIVLPVNSPWEREALKTGFEISHEAQERIALRPRMVPPVGESRSDTEIVFALATRLGLDEQFFGGDIEAGWQHILDPLGLTVAELRKRPQGIDVPLPRQHRKHTDAQPDGTVRGFATETRRAELYSERLARHGYDPLPGHVEPADSPLGDDADFPLVLTSTKASRFCHTQHRGIASLRARAAEPTVYLGPELAMQRGIAADDWVELSTRHGRIRMRAELDPALHERVVAAEYGWWESAPDIGLPGYDPFTATGSNFNLLVSADHGDPVSGSVPHRSLVCDVHKVAQSRPRWPGERPFTVTNVVAEAADTVSIHLQPSHGAAPPDFRPGQHTTVHLDHGVARSYSLSGPATAADRHGYRITVKCGDGPVSNYLTKSLRVGDIVRLTAPAGRFALPTEPDLPVVMIAGGIGITPFIGYLETMAARRSLDPITLYYVCRDGGHHAFKERLTELAAGLPGLQVHTHYTRPRAGDRPGLDYSATGRITADDVDGALISARARFYLCGPDAMIRQLRAGLAARGVPDFGIFEERFSSPVPTWTPPPDAAHTVRFLRSGRDVTWTPADGSLLALAESQGVAILSGCRTGQCESCEVPVLSGGVRYLVPEADPTDDNRCLTCQAVPISDLALDA
ncbi:molybdopterin dinucleotide-binding protein [Mycolicibacterium agri]|uniref:Molybdopterin dinucleotide-binding protein n=1 Tax=Mycolicibacterium agri TaxID=36811 RepID=A0A2A7MSW3_MYCAG|nr:molybdopterin-dependent oxidoreductase [Mycolicibacterium agri]PEG34238.1 molybdopterin dinucleotide-binding protein [Mycolicibacterium agri]GFG49678.1 molybdopterin oxidoreductase [Mycolicibacterium agri]